MPNEIIFEHPDFVIKEEVIYLEDSPDVSRTVTLQTREEEFTFTFVYDKLISFTRNKI